jgi:hypothetical protein
VSGRDAGARSVANLPGEASRRRAFDAEERPDGCAIDLMRSIDDLRSDEGKAAGGGSYRRRRE